MSHTRAYFESKIKDIDGIIIYGLPAKPIAISKAVRVESTIVLVAQDGTLYATGLAQGAYAYRDGALASRLAQIMTGLQKLGVLSKGAVEQYKALQSKSEADQRRRWAAKDILNRARDAGLTLTAAQRRELEAAAAEEGGAA